MVLSKKQQKKGYFQSQHFTDFGNTPHSLVGQLFLVIRHKIFECIS